MDKISVIIPVYNDNVYIQRCLDSLINQTYKNLEIIVVNDGSTDNTLDVLNEYAKRDNRIVVVSQENQKLGGARNTGMSVSTGEYVSFIDSDDWVDLDYYEKMYQAIVNTNADMAISSARRIKDNGSYKLYMHYEKLETYEGIDNILKAAKHPPYNAVWGKLYTKELIGDLRFEVGVFYEDINFTIRIINKTKRLVTVPDVMYNYFNNSNSIMKSAPSIQKSQNIVDAWVNFYNYIEEQGIALAEEFPIEKERYFLWSVKRYRNYADYFILGKKVFRRNEPYPRQKLFLVFNTACLGDVLVCDSLCRNIKSCYPNSRLVFVVDKPCVDVAKYMLGVDEVLVYDKNGYNKGIKGFIRFLKEFPYKNVFAAFITYKNERNTLIAALLKAKYIFRPYKWKTLLSTQKKHNNSLSRLTYKRLTNYPICYSIPSDLEHEFDKKFILPDRYVVLSPLSKKLSKDMPKETAEELIKNINQQGYKVVLTGVGNAALRFAESLNVPEGAIINMVNKTSIPELAYILKNATGLISVDTGSLHLGCAVCVPTVAVFYEKHTLVNWAPDSQLYRCITITEKQTPENIMAKFFSLLSQKV